MVTCHVCQQHRPCKPVHRLYAWLSSSCPGLTQLALAAAESASRPVRLPRESEAFVGLSRLDPSHTFWRYKGLIFCSRCGAWASRKAQHLDACPQQPPSKFAAQSVPRLLRGDLPHGLSQWPEERNVEDMVCIDDAFSDVAP